jgi:transposase
LIELLYLPSYSPELNPVEYINCYIKYKIFSKRSLRNKIELEKRIFSELRALQRRPELAKRFFDHDELKFMKNK